MDRLLEELVALERSALDRWIQLDPEGYFDIQAAEVTYFDPFTERRINGREALQMRLAPMKSLKLPFTDPRYEMIEPKVQRQGDVALLTFNLVNYGKLPDQPESVLARWNSTEVYGRIDGKWKIIQSLVLRAVAAEASRCVGQSQQRSEASHMTAASSRWMFERGKKARAGLEQPPRR